MIIKLICINLYKKIYKFVNNFIQIYNNDLIPPHILKNILIDEIKDETTIQIKDETIIQIKDETIIQDIIDKFDII